VSAHRKKGRVRAVSNHGRSPRGHWGTAKRGEHSLGSTGRRKGARALYGFARGIRPKIPIDLPFPPSMGAMGAGEKRKLR